MAPGLMHAAATAWNYFHGSDSIREAPCFLGSDSIRDRLPHDSTRKGCSGIHFHYSAGSIRAALPHGSPPKNCPSTQKNNSGIRFPYFAGPNSRFSNCSNSAE